MLDIPYEKRHGYYNALERAQKTGSERVFLMWLFGRYLKEHARHLKKDSTSASPRR